MKIFVFLSPANNIVGIIVGATVGSIVLFVIIPIIVCVVIGCAIAQASSRRTRTTFTAATQPTSATVVATSSQQGAAYPTAPQEAYPPPQYPYPPQASSNEMTTYPPKPQEAYPPPQYPPQAAYPAYPSQPA